MYIIVEIAAYITIAFFWQNLAIEVQFIFFAKLVSLTEMTKGLTNEGLTFETSILRTLYGGQFALSSRLIKPNYSVIPHRRSITVFFFQKLTLSSPRVFLQVRRVLWRFFFLSGSRTSYAHSRILR